MAESKSGKKSNVGVDSTPWEVVGTAGKPVVTGTFTGYADSSVAARRYTLETGLWAGPRRS